MTGLDYTEPVSKLITLGDVRGQKEWRDYAALGLTAEHIPDLIQMALDEDLLWADSDSVEVWTPLHAWRALGQLRAVAAVDPLITLFDGLDENMDDWIAEDLPDAIGLIGPAAIPFLRDYLADAAHGQWPRVSVSNSLVEIAKRFPEARDEVVAIISAQLANFAAQTRLLNACLVSDLALDLHAVDAAPVIEQAFAADAVDLSMMGDWEDVQIEMGLLEDRLTLRPDYFALEMPEFAETRDRLRTQFPKLLEAASSPQKPKHKLGRNDPCWCGSGKKYKYCHLREDQER